MIYVQNLKLCIKPTGFGYICPNCGAESHHLLPIPSPRFIREGSIAEYAIPIVKCMKCNTTIEGKRYLTNPEEVKKSKKELILVFGIAIILTLFIMTCFLYAKGVF